MVKNLKITINGLKWTVRNAAPDSTDLKPEGCQYPAFGVTKFATLEIFLRDDQSKELYRQTVIHELLHAYTFSFGVHLLADEHTEEPIADFVGAHLDQIHNDANKITNTLGKG